MIPRYKVIADYPNQPFPIGDILPSRNYEYFPITTIVYKNEFGENVRSVNWVESEVIDKYPALFRKLNWYEERDIEDMPKYVKIIDENVIAKVEEHNMNLGFTYKETSYFKTEHSRRKVYSTNVIPSSEQEYNDYINPKP